MKKIPLLASLCLLFGIAFGQTKLPTAYLITADTAQGNISLPDSCWQIFADPTGKMTLHQALQSAHFRDTNKKIDYHFNTYWLRYRIINKTAKDVEISLPFSNVQYVNLYVRTDSARWQHYRTGTMIPWNKRDGIKSQKTMNLIIPPGKALIVYEQDTYDYKISGSSVKETVSFHFVHETNELQKQWKHFMNILPDIFLLGVILLAIVINIYFYIIVREKEFLYFALSILFFGLNSLGFLENIFFRNLPLVNPYLHYFSLILMWFFFIYFIRHFLKTFRDFPKWDKFLIALAIADVIISFFADFGIAILYRKLNILFALVGGYFLIMGLSLLITFFLYRRNRDKSVRLIIYAVAPLAIIFTIMTLLLVPLNIYNLYHANHNAVPGFISVVTRVLTILNYVIPFTLTWMIIFFACTLFIRFSMLRRRYAQEKLESEQERGALIEQQKTELEKQVTERTSELRQSLDNLKSTQKQLIQSEKMASLGELTAGIAHEIQNPLNFVNNFSEVNKELIGEIKAERLSDRVSRAGSKPKAERNEEVEDDLLKDIDVNSERIIHHGKRADAIVKGMLEHSRMSTGKKEPTNINALADEYLRLSYHGMRAKDKSFNATMKTDFDETIGTINVVPQDIGRVLLNLFNNAFYACAERSRSSTSSDTGSPTGNYEPTVSVSTKKLNGKIEIKVKDNGNGIPEEIKNKIFQPFFTTKPTGEGTGLGLSLSYDMIKAHDGDIMVNSKEGEETEFVVMLPV